jgi:hypothetical protein
VETCDRFLKLKDKEEVTFGLFSKNQKDSDFPAGF